MIYVITPSHLITSANIRIDVVITNVIKYNWHMFYSLKSKIRHWAHTSHFGPLIGL